MIPLPTLTIERDEIEEVQLTDMARQWLEREDHDRAQGLHASDLLDPRQTFWSKISPKPLSERQVWLFTIGKVLHTLVGLVRGNPDRFPHEPGPELDRVEHRHPGSDTGSFEALGIVFSPDLFQDGEPVEFKTNRSPFEPTGGKEQETYTVYLEQLAIYMALMRVLRGRLWVLYLNLKEESRRTYPEPRCYRVSLTPTELYDLERTVLATRDRVQDALTHKDPTGLELCRDWKCGTACAWWEDCRPPGRYPAIDKRRWTA